MTLNDQITLNSAFAQVRLEFVAWIAGFRKQFRNKKLSYHLETGRQQYIFVMGSERRTFSAIEFVTAIQGHPRSLILAPIAYPTSY